MADYIYLLENRLSPAQRSALDAVRGLARSKGLTVFLVGGAVRDLTSGSPVTDLDVAIQGNALKLKKDLQSAGASIAGEYEAWQTLFVRFPSGVRMEIGSTLTVTYPKPGRPAARPGTILEDLRRRDFTANAMALSLNEGSYGLLMDPMNGVADIENRQLRLVSNYGFIEEPIRMVRAARLMARLGWSLEEKTLSRYETGKQEDYIAAMQEFQRGYELEEIVHEEDPLRVMRVLEGEGWMKALAPYWSVAKANIPELEKLRETQTQMQLQGIHPDAASAHFPLLTAKLSAKEVADLKNSFPRQGFVAEIESLERESKEFATQLSGKGAAAPSQSWKLIVSATPEAVLWTAYSTRSAALQAKFKSFFTEWPLVKQKVPYALMQEMRITPELPGFAELVEKLMFELMDGKLDTVEEIKAFLEPYSPPAPPPPVSMRRPRASKKEPKGKSRARKLAVKLDDEDDEAVDADLEDADVDLDAGDDDEVIELPPIVDDEEIADVDLVDDDLDDDADEDDSDDEDDIPVKKPSAKAPAKKAAAKTVEPVVLVKEQAAAVKLSPPVAAKPPAEPSSKALAKNAAKAVVKSAAVKPVPATKAKVAPAPAKKSAPAKKPVPAKKTSVAKKSVPHRKAAPAKKTPAKPANLPQKSGKLKTPQVPAKKVVAKAKAAPPVKGKKR